MQDKILLISYIINNEIKTNKAAYPWKLINENEPTFFEEIEVARNNSSISGTGVKFLSSDPKVLMNKLKILLAEKNAGNNNV